MFIYIISYFINNVPCIYAFKILPLFRLQPNMKCIIFVNRIVTARSLSYILNKLKFISSWRCNFLVGVHSGLKSMSRKNTNIILEKFRSGEVMMLLVLFTFCFSHSSIYEPVQEFFELLGCCLCTFI